MIRIGAYVRFNTTKRVLVTLVVRRGTGGVPTLDPLGRTAGVAHAIEEHVHEGVLRDLGALERLYPKFDPSSRAYERLAPGEESRFLAHVNRLAAMARFNLLSGREAHLARTRRFEFTLPLYVDWRNLSPLWASHPLYDEAGEDAPPFRSKLMVAHRGTGLKRVHRFMFSDKADELYRRLVHELHRRLRDRAGKLRAKAQGLHPRAWLRPAAAGSSSAPKPALLEHRETESADGVSANGGPFTCLLQPTGSKPRVSTVPLPSVLRRTRVALEHLPLYPRQLVGKVSITDPTYEQVLLVYREVASPPRPSERQVGLSSLRRGVGAFADAHRRVGLLAAVSRALRGQAGERDTDFVDLTPRPAGGAAEGARVCMERDEDGEAQPSAHQVDDAPEPVGEGDGTVLVRKQPSWGERLQTAAALVRDYSVAAAWRVMYGPQRRGDSAGDAGGAKDADEGAGESTGAPEPSSSLTGLIRSRGLDGSPAQFRVDEGGLPLVGDGAISSTSNPHNVRVELLKGVPWSEVNMLYPGATASIRPMDRAKFWALWLAGTGLLVPLSQHQALSLPGLLALSAIGAYAYKVGYRYYFSRLYYHYLVSDHLDQFRSSTGGDALVALARMAHRQRVRELCVVYHTLAVCGEGDGEVDQHEQLEQHQQREQHQHGGDGCKAVTTDTVARRFVDSDAWALSMPGSSSNWLTASEAGVTSSSEVRAFVEDALRELAVCGVVDASGDMWRAR